MKTASLRYITDHLKRLVPVLLLVAGLGVLLICIGVPKEQTAVIAFGAGMIALALILLLWQTCGCIRTLRLYKQAGLLPEFLADYSSAALLCGFLRMGRRFMFYGTECVAYADVRSMHAAVVKEHRRDGSLAAYFELYAGVKGGRTERLCRLNYNVAASLDRARDAFTRAMQIARQCNPAIRVTPPEF